MVKVMLDPGTTTVVREAPDGRRRRRVKLFAAGAVVVALLPLGASMAAVPSWGNPFAPQVVDRSPAPLLTALQNVAQYRAATGRFQVLVDVEKDTPNIPSVISGERTTLFATGHVDGIVDFSRVGPERVLVSPDRLSVTIMLPAPVLEPAVVDPVESRIVGRERGLVERVTGVFEDVPRTDQELYALAAQKLDVAARTSDLPARSEQSTRTMLTTLAGSLGFEQVTVVFDPPDQR